MVWPLKTQHKRHENYCVRRFCCIAGFFAAISPELGFCFLDTVHSVLSLNMPELTMHPKSLVYYQPCVCSTVIPFRGEVNTKQHTAPSSWV